MGAAALALGAWAAHATHAGPGGGASHHEGPPSSRIATCPKPPWATSWSQALGAGHHHGELLEAHVGWLPLGDVDDEVTTTRASAPARSAAAATT